MTGGHIRNRRALKSTTTNNTSITGIFDIGKGVDNTYLNSKLNRYLLDYEILLISFSFHGTIDLIRIIPSILRS